MVGAAVVGAAVVGAAVVGAAVVGTGALVVVDGTGSGVKVVTTEVVVLSVVVNCVVVELVTVAPDVVVVTLVATCLKQANNSRVLISIVSLSVGFIGTMVIFLAKTANSAVSLPSLSFSSKT